MEDNNGLEIHTPGLYVGATESSTLKSTTLQRSSEVSRWNCCHPCLVEHNPLSEHPSR